MEDYHEKNIKSKKDSEELEIKYMLKNLAVSEYTLNKNFQELSNKINFYPVKSKKREIHLFIDEIRRLLHNYLASVYSLDEHTKNFFEILNNQQLKEKYKKELTKMENKKLKCFLIRLRAYSQHYNLFSPNLLLKWKKYTRNFKEAKSIDKILVLDKKRLLDIERKKPPGWRGWGNNVIKDIENSKDRIDLKDVIEEYQEFSKKFCSYLYEEVISIYSKKYPNMKELIQELEEIRRTEDRRRKEENMEE